jgi:hypothetical protein
LKDHHFWVTSLKQTRHGDTNLDGEVSFPDFVLLADNFGGAGGWGQGDFDADGQVQFADFVLLANNFGQGKTGDAAAVPEPDWAVLAFLGLVVLLIVTRMRQNRRGDPDSRQFNNSTIQQGDSRKWS